MSLINRRQAQNTRHFRGQILHVSRDNNTGRWKSSAATITRIKERGEITERRERPCGNKNSITFGKEKMVVGFFVVVVCSSRAKQRTGCDKQKAGGEKCIRRHDAKVTEGGERG